MLAICLCTDGVLPLSAASLWWQLLSGCTASGCLERCFGCRDGKSWLCLSFFIIPLFLEKGWKHMYIVYYWEFLDQNPILGKIFTIQRNFPLRFWPPFQQNLCPLPRCLISERQSTITCHFFGFFVFLFLFSLPGCTSGKSTPSIISLCIRRLVLEPARPFLEIP